MSSSEATHEPRPQGREADPLEAPRWIPSAPPRSHVRRGVDRLRHRRAPTSLRSVLACAALGAVATASLTFATGIEVVAGSGSDSATGAGAAGLVGAGPGGQQTPTSVAITAEAGPFHPVRLKGRLDYGDAGAKFGASRGGRAHEGQDVFADSGTPVIAVRDGIVVEKGDDGGRGNYVAIHNPARDETYAYLHMQKPSWLKPGDEVAAGVQVGAMGCTGSCYGTHLHFEIRRGDEVDGKALDPLPMLKRWAQAP